jgi:RNA polymerase sigma factor (sigma-70 family)
MGAFVCSENQDRQTQDDTTFDGCVEKFVRVRTKRYGHRIKAGRRLLPHFEDMEDLVQTVHLHLLMLDPAYGQCVDNAASPGEDFSNSTLYAAVCCAYSRAADCLGGKYAKRWKRGQPQEEALDCEVESSSDSDLLDLSLDLAQVLAGLSEQDRLVWTRAFEGQTYRKIGEDLGIPFQTVSRILDKARQKLARALNA